MLTTMETNRTQNANIYTQFNVESNVLVEHTCFCIQTEIVSENRPLWNWCVNPFRGSYCLKGPYFQSTPDLAVGWILTPWVFPMNLSLLKTTYFWPALKANCQKFKLLPLEYNSVKMRGNNCKWLQISQIIISRNTIIKILSHFMSLLVGRDVTLKAVLKNEITKSIYSTLS